MLLPILFGEDSKPMSLNLLIEPLVNSLPHGKLTLPGLLAGLACDEIHSFPALRPHQGPAWHMFLVQLASLALCHEGVSDLPRNEIDWKDILLSYSSDQLKRHSKIDFVGDEPWHLISENEALPAFLQSPVSDGITLQGIVRSPDLLDMLITSKNHELKQTIAHRNHPEDWIFALVSLQTCAGYDGPKNYGIARMAKGSSSRMMVTQAPYQSTSNKSMTPSLGGMFQRNVSMLLENRGQQIKKFSHLDYRKTGGLGLTWIYPWPEKHQLTINELDIWFIEVCRRVRLQANNEIGQSLICRKGTSEKARTKAKHLIGNLGDPFAPIHKSDAKSLTLNLGEDFDYQKLTEVLLSGDYELPILATSTQTDNDSETIAIVTAAIARGPKNCRTEGFKYRILPLRGQTISALGSSRRQLLHKLAKDQIKEIDDFCKILHGALLLFAKNGERDQKKNHNDQKKYRNKGKFRYANEAKKKLQRKIDNFFFEHLWLRFRSQENSNVELDRARLDFINELYSAAKATFNESLVTIPCARIFRYRAEVRARMKFYRGIRNGFPELFNGQEIEN